MKCNYLLFAIVFTYSYGLSQSTARKVDDNNSGCVYEYYNDSCQLQTVYKQNCINDGIIHIVTDPELITGTGQNNLSLRYSSDAPASFDYNNNCLYSGNSYQIGAQFEVQVPVSALSDIYYTSTGVLDFNVQCFLYKDGQQVLNAPYVTNLINDGDIIVRPANSFTHNDFEVRCLDPSNSISIGAISIYINFNQVFLDKYSMFNYNRFIYQRKPKYSIVFLIADLDHQSTSFNQADLLNELDVDYNSSACMTSTASVQDIKFFNELNKSSCGHVNDHIVILDIPICDPVYKDIKTNVDMSSTYSLAN